MQAGGSNVTSGAYDERRATRGNGLRSPNHRFHYLRMFPMKRLVSALMLSVLLVSGTAAVANAAPAKGGNVSSTDRVNNWPY